MLDSILSLKTLAPVFLCLATCGGARGDLRQHVGDGNLPAVAVGPREQVSLMLAAPTSDGTTNLSIRLTPDGKLTLNRYAMHWPQPYFPQETKGVTDSFKLPLEQAENFRSLLAQLRPPNLGREGPFVLPKDCPWAYDDRSSAVVAFVDEHGRSGSFILQFSCKNANADTIAIGLRQAVQALPRSKATAGFSW